MTTRWKSQTVTATEFKARCLELMDVVRDSEARITITKRGKPVAQLVSVPTSRPRFYASLPVTIVGDIVESVGEPWEADR